MQSYLPTPSTTLLFCIDLLRAGLDNQYSKQWQLPRASCIVGLLLSEPEATLALAVAEYV